MENISVQVYRQTKIIDVRGRLWKQSANECECFIKQVRQEGAYWAAGGRLDESSGKLASEMCSCH
jgi:hypothetical protein